MRGGLVRQTRVAGQKNRPTQTHQMYQMCSDSAHQPGYGGGAANWSGLMVKGGSLQKINFYRI